MARRVAHTTVCMVRVADAIDHADTESWKKSQANYDMLTEDGNEAASCWGKLPRAVQFSYMQNLHLSQKI